MLHPCSWFFLLFQTVALLLFTELWLAGLNNAEAGQEMTNCVCVEAFSLANLFMCILNACAFGMETVEISRHALILDFP